MQNNHTLHVDESQRQMIIMALAHLAAERPGWNMVLTELAQTMDTPESWKRRQVEAIRSRNDVTVPRGQPVMFTRFKEYHLSALREVVIQKMAEEAAAKWNGYHEHMCGTGEKESHFVDGYMAGWKASIEKHSSLDHEHNTRPQSGPTAGGQDPAAK